MTSHSTPLQIKTTDLQKTLEGSSGSLLRLGMATARPRCGSPPKPFKDRMAALAGELRELAGLFTLA